MLLPSQLTLNFINQLYIDAVNRHLGGMKQERGGSSGKFASKSLQAPSWRGFLQQVFKHIQLVDCPCGQRNFLCWTSNQMIMTGCALIHHIERSHAKDKDSISFCPPYKFASLSWDRVNPLVPKGPPFDE